MHTHQRITFATIFITALVLLAPAFALAQSTTTTTTTVTTHPNVVSPTKAPTKPLPPSPLPNGLMTVTTTTIAAPGAVPDTTTGSLDWLSNTTILYSLIGLAVLVIGGLWWAMAPRKGEAGESETTTEETTGKPEY